jgi:copper transport protein
VCALALVLVGGWRARNRLAAGLLLRSFGGVALLSVATVAITGLYSAGVEVDAPGQLVSSFYGRTLLIKTGLFLAVGAVGLANSLLVRSNGRGSSRLGLGVRLEAGLVGGVILLAALLTASAPAQGRLVAAPAPVQSASAALASTQAGDLLVTLSVKPNRPGVNFVTAGVFDTRRPAPGPIRTVDLSLDAGGRWTKATRVRAGYWQLTGQRARAGPWSIAIRVGRPGLPARLVTIPWRLPVALPPPPASRTLGGHSLAAIVTPLSAALALLLLLLAPLILRAGHRRRLPGALLRRASARFGSSLGPVEAARTTRE